MLTITLNGESRDVPSGSVRDLLASLDLPEKKIAVERNLEIVPRSAYGETFLEGGDRIEIVQFVGGG